MVSGALTGIMMAYEDATGEKLDEEKKEIASEEIVAVGDLGNEIGKDKATGIVNDIKTEIIKTNTKDTNQIAETINNVTNNYNVTLNVGQMGQLQDLMGKIAKQSYNYNAVKSTLDTVTSNVDANLEAIGESIKRGGFFENMFSGIKDFFGKMFGGAKEEVKDLGILANTKDEVLGESAVIDATDEGALQLEEVQDGAKGLLGKIVEWFKGLFGGTTDVSKDKTNGTTNNLDTNSENIEEDITDEAVDDSNSTNTTDVIDGEEDSLIDVIEDENNGEDGTVNIDDGNTDLVTSIKENQ